MNKHIVSNIDFTIENSNNNYDIIINGIIKHNIDNNLVFYYAASPPDYNNSYSGSGMPFHSKFQAFYETPNIGKVKVESNKFIIKINKPNSYYESIAESDTITKPYIMIYYYMNGEKIMKKIELDEEIHYRDIRYNKSHTGNVLFYDNMNLPIRSQEQVLRDSAYNTKGNSFWNLKPPV